MQVHLMGTQVLPGARAGKHAGGGCAAAGTVAARVQVAPQALEIAPLRRFSSRQGRQPRANWSCSSNFGHGAKRLAVKLTSDSVSVAWMVKGGM